MRGASTPGCSRRGARLFRSRSERRRRAEEFGRSRDGEPDTLGLIFVLPHATCYSRAPMPSIPVEHIAWSKVRAPLHRYSLADSAIAAPDLGALGLPHAAELPPEGYRAQA